MKFRATLQMNLQLLSFSFPSWSLDFYILKHLFVLIIIILCEFK